MACLLKCPDKKCRKKRLANCCRLPLDLLGDGLYNVDEPWQDRGGPTVAKYDPFHVVVDYAFYTLEVFLI